MKKMLIAGLVLFCFFFFPGCEESDSDSANDATSLGSSLSFSGTIDRTFTVMTQTWATSSDTYFDDFNLNDESDDTIYATQNNADGSTDINLTYSGTTHESHLLSTSAWTGMSVSDSNVQIATVQIEVEDPSWDEIAYCQYDSTTLQWYYYLYATGELTLNGSFTDDGETHTYNNIRFFEGWNQVIKATTDGVSFSYSAGTLDDGHWCYMDNPES